MKSSLQNDLKDEEGEDEEDQEDQDEEEKDDEIELSLVPKDDASQMNAYATCQQFYKDSASAQTIILNRFAKQLYVLNLMMIADILKFSSEVLKSVQRDFVEKWMSKIKLNDEQMQLVAAQPAGACKWKYREWLRLHARSHTEASAVTCKSGLYSWRSIIITWIVESFQAIIRDLNERKAMVAWTTVVANNPWYHLFQQLRQLLLSPLMGEYKNTHQLVSSKLKRMLAGMSAANVNSMELNAQSEISIKNFIPYLHQLLRTIELLPLKLQGIFTFHPHYMYFQRHWRQAVSIFKTKNVSRIAGSCIFKFFMTLADQIAALAQTTDDAGRTFRGHAVLIMMVSGMRVAEALMNSILLPCTIDDGLEPAIMAKRPVWVGYRDKLSAGRKFYEPALIQRYLIAFDPVRVTFYHQRMRVHCLWFLINKCAPLNVARVMQRYAQLSKPYLVRRKEQHDVFARQVRHAVQALLDMLSADYKHDLDRLDSVTAWLLQQSSTDMTHENEVFRLCSQDKCVVAQVVWLREVWRALLNANTPWEQKDRPKSDEIDKLDDTETFDRQNLHPMLYSRIQTFMRVNVKHELGLDKKMDSHDCRRLYVNMAYALYGENEVMALFVQRMLGHDSGDLISGLAYTIYNVQADVDQYGNKLDVSGLNQLARKVGRLQRDVERPHSTMDMALMDRKLNVLAKKLRALEEAK